MNYFDHNDRAGIDTRLRVLNSREARERYLATLAEYDANDITLYMGKHELQARLREACRMRYPWMYMLRFAAENWPTRREFRNERDANRAGFTCAGGR